MIEHFDEYAEGRGRGPAVRGRDLDPWRSISNEQYERGRYVLTLDRSYEAAVTLRSDAKQLSDCFMRWFKPLDPNS